MNLSAIIERQHQSLKNSYVKAEVSDDSNDSNTQVANDGVIRHPMYLSLKPESSLIHGEKKVKMVSLTSNESQKSVSSTAANLATEDWSGKYGFEMGIANGSDSKSSRSLTYSKLLKKMFVDYDRLFKLLFTFVKPPEDYGKLSVRGTIVYNSPSFFFEPVITCPNHRAKLSLASPHLPEARIKSVLVINDNNLGDITYEMDPTSQRVSSVISLTKPLAGTNHIACFYKFACLGSCVGGINRRPTTLIFTLEENGEVVGRRSIPMRICSCPTRDMKQEELKLNGEVPKLKKRHARASPNLLPLPSKLLKTSSDDAENSLLTRYSQGSTSSEYSDGVIDQIDSARPYFLVPVFGHENFRAVNKFAEFLDYQCGLTETGRCELLQEFND